MGVRRRPESKILGGTPDILPLQGDPPTKMFHIFDATAYTNDPSKTGKGWQITFCANFFTKQYLNAITMGTKPSSVNSLISYEHLLAHEFMVRLRPESMLDRTLIVATNFSIAGSLGTTSLVSLWSKVNIETGLNDNYAWFATSNWFYQKWHYSLKKRQEYSDSDIDDPPGLNITFEGMNDIINDGVDFDDDGWYGDDADFTINSLADMPENITWPANCRLPSDTDPEGALDCDYIGGNYADWIDNDTGYVTVAPQTLPVVNATTATEAASLTLAAPSIIPAGSADAAPYHKHQTENSLQIDGEPRVYKIRRLSTTVIFADLISDIFNWWEIVKNLGWPSAFIDLHIDSK
ncbi:MAG: hypothetical protein M1827_007266 [Pycnora praestabilis]|nr:MAG: hypothetical protein M1827_007266 [Pycnora praestabilis]